MTKEDNTNDISVSENHHNIIMPNSVGITESGLWNMFIHNDTGNKLYKPRDPDDFNKYYHEHKRTSYANYVVKPLLSKHSNITKLINAD